MFHNLYQNLFPNLFQNPAGVGHICPQGTAAGSHFQRPASGCKGHDSLRSSTPCPSAIPRHSALVRSRVGEARPCSLCLKGKGCAPCTPARSGSHDACASESWPQRTRSALPRSRSTGVDHGRVLVHSAWNAFICVPVFLWVRDRLKKLSLEMQNAALRSFRRLLVRSVT